MNKTTPHINAKKSDFAPVVLMPGDPLRAKWIAENFLENAVQINEVRNMLGYTGTYQGHKITVMGHGMGNPSIGIYSYELLSPDFYDVKAIIRIGSCGSLVKDIKVKDVFISATTYSESCYAQLVGIETEQGVLKADPKLVELVEKTAKELNIEYHKGQGYASDVFYGIRSLEDTVKETQSQVVEMEAFALYANAQLLKKQAICLLTVSDSLVTHEAMSAQERQTTFSNMVKLALNVAIKIK